MFQSKPPNVFLADIRKTPGRADEMIEILFAALHESAMGHKRTFVLRGGISAFEDNADISIRSRMIRFGPALRLRLEKSLVNTERTGVQAIKINETSIDSATRTLQRCMSLLLPKRTYNHGARRCAVHFVLLTRLVGTHAMPQVFTWRLKK